jgi:hypothetical protein
VFCSDSSSDNPYEKDSQDSNRESAEQNDYPDEEDDQGSDQDHNHSSDSEGFSNRKRKMKPCEAVPNATWLDKLLRKQKSGVTQIKTI